MSSRRVARDKAGLLPEVEVVDGVATLTDRGRYQVGLFVIVDRAYYVVHTGSLVHVYVDVV